MTDGEYDDKPSQLATLYSSRFDGRAPYRERVWATLNQHFFDRWIAPGDAVLDVGCGYGEFINTVVARERYAIDLNPDSVRYVDDAVTLIRQDCSAAWPLADGALDVVFSSNFLEHLEHKDQIRATLVEAHRCLRPGGRLVLLGPNIRYAADSYWDFFDHHIPLSDRSLAEIVRAVGFDIERVVPRFLPFTMSEGRERPVALVRAYLRLPVAWRILGKQFLVVGRRPPSIPT